MNGLALATVAATFVLILAGGLVTNTGAGLAVPDRPTAFGYTMFLVLAMRAASAVPGRWRGANLRSENAVAR